VKKCFVFGVASTLPKSKGPLIMAKKLDPTPFFGPLPMIVKEPVFGSSLVVHSL
jgi:hypothetical protein